MRQVCGGNAENPSLNPAKQIKQLRNKVTKTPETLFLRYFVVQLISHPRG
jgi:hypothetical protein